MITITRYNTTVAGVPEDYPLDTAAVRRAISKSGLTTPDRDRVVRNLAAADQGNATSVSVAALARTLLGGPRQEVDALCRVIGDTMTADTGTNPAEAKEFDELLANGAVRSYEKGTAGTIAASALPVGKKAQNREQLQAAVAAVRRIHQTLAAGPLPRETFYDSDPGGYVGLLTPSTLNLRSPHSNASGWLPASTTAARRTTLTDEMTALIDTGVARAAAAGNPLPPQRVAWHALNGRFGGRGEDRQLYLWHQASAEDRSSYMEVGGVGGSNGRLVFDYETGTFYWTVHYKWHRGCNPFFRISGI